MQIDRIPHQVLESHPTFLLLKVSFPLESGFFNGHFPDFQLLPGVIQLHLVFEFVQKYLNLDLKFRGFKFIKFFSPIYPRTHLLLKIQIQKNSLNFQYFSEDLTCSKGSLICSTGAEENVLLEKLAEEPLP